MTNDFDGDALRKRLDAIIRLLLENSPGGAETTSKKIERLRELGFSNSEIAQMFGKEPNYVRAVVSGKKQSSSRKKRDKS